MVSDALDEAYPRTDTLEAIPREDAVSPAVYTLLSTLCDKFDSLPVRFGYQAFEAVLNGLNVWLNDDNKVVMPADANTVSISSFIESIGLEANFAGGYAICHCFATY